MLAKESNIEPTFKADEYKNNSTHDDLPASKYPKQKFELLDALEYLKKNIDNFTDENFIPPTLQSLNMTKYFINKLFLNVKHADIIAPDGDAGIMLKWKDEESRTLLTIDGIALHLSYKKNNHEPIFIENIRFFDASSDTIAQEILNYIPTL